MTRLGRPGFRPDSRTGATVRCGSTAELGTGPRRPSCCSRRPGRGPTARRTGGRLALAVISSSTRPLPITATGSLTGSGERRRLAGQHAERVPGAPAAPPGPAPPGRLVSAAGPRPAVPGSSAGRPAARAGAPPADRHDPDTWPPPASPGRAGTPPWPTRGVWGTSTENAGSVVSPASVEVALEPAAQIRQQGVDRQVAVVAARDPGQAGGRGGRQAAQVGVGLVQREQRCRPRRPRSTVMAMSARTGSGPDSASRSTNAPVTRPVSAA